MITLEDYIKDLQAQGESAFTAQEAAATLEISQSALNARVHRLMKQGELVAPAKHFYVPVPPKHRFAGCIPAADLVPLLMKYKQQPYYVGLLSAALYHGASHQKPQRFQVVVDRQMRDVIIGKVFIEFVYKKTFVDLPLQDIVVTTGYLKVASPELTAMDLLLYPARVGGLNHIATVLSELIETLDPEKLMALIRKVDGKAWVQRLGWILEKIETTDDDRQKSVVNILEKYIATQSLSYVPLASELPTKGCTRNGKWLIIENTTVESDYDS